MDESEAEKLIERGLSAGRPREMFTAQLLADSTAALVQNRRSRARRRMAGLAAAAILIASISFLGGRLSAPPAPTGNVEVAARGAAESDSATVPRDLVTWLEAANLFRQLGMPDRMARAVNRAGNLLPAELAAGDGASPNEREDASLPEMPAAHQTSRTIHRIMAQSVGD